MKRSSWSGLALVAFLLLVPGAIPATLIYMGGAKYLKIKQKKHK